MEGKKFNFLRHNGGNKNKFLPMLWKRREKLSGRKIEPESQKEKRTEY